MCVSNFQNFFNKTFLFFKKYMTEYYIIAKLLVHILLESQFKNIKNILHNYYV